MKNKLIHFLLVFLGLVFIIIGGLLLNLEFSTIQKKTGESIANESFNSAVNKHDDSNNSTTNQLRIKLKYPAHERFIAIEQHEIESGIELKFQWSGSFSENQPSTLLISSKQDFSDIIHKGSYNRDSAIIKMKPGIWYWQVIYSTKDQIPNKELGSPIQNFIISSGIAPEKKLPVIVFPKKNSKINMTNRNNLYFRWQDTIQNREYHFELYQYTSRGLKKIFEKDTKNMSLIYRKLSKLDRGRFLIVLRVKYNKEERYYSGKSYGPKVFSYFWIELKNPKIPEVYSPTIR